MNDSELKEALKQIVNRVSAGVNKEDLPENIRLAVPSFDNVKAVDELLELFHKYSDKARDEECDWFIEKTENAISQKAEAIRVSGIIRLDNKRKESRLTSNKEKDKD